MTRANPNSMISCANLIFDDAVNGVLYVTTNEKHFLVRKKMRFVYQRNTLNLFVFFLFLAVDKHADSQMAENSFFDFYFFGFGKCCASSKFERKKEAKRREKDFVRNFSESKKAVYLN